MRIICISLSLLFLFLGCEKSLDPIVENDNLIGKWSESFKTYYIKQIILPEDTTNIVTVERRTILEFSNDNFRVETNPHVPNINGVYDTTYQGSYCIKSDTLIFNINRFNAEKKLLFRFKYKRLVMEIPTYQINDSLFSKEFNSFIWGGSMGKTTGIFSRDK
jgi:hypothetical protein